MQLLLLLLVLRSRTFTPNGFVDFWKGLVKGRGEDFGKGFPRADGQVGKQVQGEWESKKNKQN